MTHLDKAGKPKIVDKCKFPLTGKNVVDMIITELAVFDVDHKSHDLSGLMLLEIAEGISVEEIRSKTGASFKVSDKLKTF
jgi:3-oxoacid CoA-transferase